MDKKGDNLLYEQVYLFFLKKGSNDLIMDYIDLGLNLVFNYNSLLIITSDDSYTITVVINDKKKYWNIYSNMNEQNYYVLCRDGNLNDVFKYIYHL